MNEREHETASEVKAALRGVKRFFTPGRDFGLGIMAFARSHVDGREVIVVRNAWHGLHKVRGADYAIMEKPAEPVYGPRGEDYPEGETGDWVGLLDSEVAAISDWSTHRC